MRLTRRVKEVVRRGLHGLVCAGLRARSRPYPFPVAPVALFVAPHADDETLGCGCLIARKRLQADPVHVVYITDGSAAYPEHPELLPPRLAAVREAEARAAMHLLGVDRTELTFLGAADGTLGRLDSAEAGAIGARIAAVLARVKPDEIFLPCRRDGSSEHDATFTLVMAATAELGLCPRIFEYPIWARWSPYRLIRPALASRRIWRVDSRGYDVLKQRGLASYVSQTKPVPPWTESALSKKFVSVFTSGNEYFFEA